MQTHLCLFQNLCSFYCARCPPHRDFEKEHRWPLWFKPENVVGNAWFPLISHGFDHELETLLCSGEWLGLEQQVQESWDCVPECFGHLCSLPGGVCRVREEMVRPYGKLFLGMEQKERNQQKTVVFTWEEEIQSRDLCGEPKIIVWDGGYSWEPSALGKIRWGGKRPLGWIGQGRCYGSPFVIWNNILWIVPFCVNLPWRTVVEALPCILSLYTQWRHTISCLNF